MTKIFSYFYLAEFLVVHVPDGGDLLGLTLLDGGHLLSQGRVLCLQRLDLGDVGCQSVIEMAQGPLLFRPGDLGG